MNKAKYNYTWTQHGETFYGHKAIILHQQNLHPAVISLCLCTFVTVMLKSILIWLRRKRTEILVNNNNYVKAFVVWPSITASYQKMIYSTILRICSKREILFLNKGQIFFNKNDNKTLIICIHAFFSQPYLTNALGKTLNKKNELFELMVA